ncbi:hypothetical protein AAFF_G00305910 [Aldrovandia affinis]|uniref:Uncharacterized protein n=1 Tax=Aldrovandia affinis TaxID=143900 RepID=A0AAD7SPP0_9TELE|nr:hypothetical protein AAFF_G00305910 [Aldrovandia affinis]
MRRDRVSPIRCRGEIRSAVVASPGARRSLARAETLCEPGRRSRHGCGPSRRLPSAVPFTASAPQFCTPGAATDGSAPLSKNKAGFECRTRSKWLPKHAGFQLESERGTSVDGERACAPRAARRSVTRGIHASRPTIVSRPKFVLEQKPSRCHTATGIARSQSVWVDLLRDDERGSLQSARRALCSRTDTAVRHSGPLLIDAAPN